jgi:hypothetical protein
MDVWDQVQSSADLANAWIKFICGSIHRLEDVAGHVVEL